MPKPRNKRKPRHVRRKAVHAANCGVAAVGAFGMAGLAVYLFVFSPLPGMEIGAEAARPVVSPQVIAVRPAEPALVSQPVHLYRAGEKPSRSARAVELANHAAVLAVFEAGRAGR